MTRRPPRSMTRVVEPRDFSTSPSEPTARKRPSRTATACASGCSGFTGAILPLWRIKSAMFMERLPIRHRSFVRGRGNHVIGNLRGGSAVYHRVGVLNARAVGAEVRLDDV